MTGTLLLWDIDGTLLSTGGAGRGALNEAFLRLHDVEGAFRRVSFGGRTDNGIAAQAFSLAGVPMDDDAIPALKARYLPVLEARLRDHADRIQLCPGVPGILSTCEPLGINALLTGNWQRGALRKLQAVGLWQHFKVGAFGDDSADRNDLVPIAEARARAAGLQFDRTVVIGDTPHDVACARAGGALAVAVCTGWSEAQVLRESEPDLLLTDLVSGQAELLELLKG